MQPHLMDLLFTRKVLLVYLVALTWPGNGNDNNTAELPSGPNVRETETSSVNAMTTYSVELEVTTSAVLYTERHSRETNTTEAGTVKTTTVNKYTKEQKEKQDFQKNVRTPSYKTSFYVIVIFSGVGLIFNLIAAVVFVTSKMIRTPVGMYTVSLCVADSIYLISEAIYWTNDAINGAPTGWSYLDTNDALCKVTPYLRRCGKNWSASLTLLLTIERYICIEHPFRANLRSKTVTIISIVVSALLSFILPIPLVQYDKVYDFLNLCLVDANNAEFYDTYDLVVVRILAEGVIGVFIFIFTCLIINSLFKARKLSLQMVNTQTVRKARLAQDSQINNMLLIIVFMFFLTRLPQTVAYYLYTYSARGDIYLSVEIFRVVLVSYYLTRAFSIFNYSTNFIIYVVFVRTFRNNMMMTCLNVLSKITRKDEMTPDFDQIPEVSTTGSPT